jgi:Flp pilus assembly protein TadD/tRNA A-37 threonylcarbamoyl transferase component Bud32
MIGQRIGHYVIMSMLGEGGMGEVYLAKDTKLGRDVALKVVPKEYTSDPSRLRRFEREAKTVAALNHPNIVTVHSIEEVEGTHFLTMECVQGESVDRLIPPEGMPVDAVFDIAIPLTDALAAAHQQGIVHRDLKPANVMVSKEDRVKVLDFGLAKLTDDWEGDGLSSGASQAPTRATTLTQDGGIVGTVPYMSPEQLDGKQVDHRSDIFSLGVLLYELVTGRQPFRGNSAPAVMSAILRDAPTPVSDLNVEAPRHLGRIIQRCLEKNPADRYQSASEVQSEMKALRREVESGEFPPRRRRDTRIDARVWGGMALAVFSILAAVVLILELSGGPETGEGVEPAAELPTASAFNARDWIIAVMPSQTAAVADADVAALNEGLAFTLTAKLAQLSREHDLQVIPANLLREEGIDSLEKARRELGVTLALNFDTHRFDDRVRVNVQLVDVPRQRQLMAETIDGYMDDLLALEEKVTIRVLRLLRVELRPMEQDLLQAGTSEPKAHAYYLRGQGYLQSFLESENIEPAVTLFEQALRVDPAYARAHAGLGEAFWRRYEMTGDSRWVEAAFEECRTAVELDEFDVAGHVCLGHLYNGTGRTEEAISELELASSLDPANDQALRGLADAYLSDGEMELAEETYREAIALRPHYWAGYNWLGIFYIRQGRYPEAIQSFEEVVRLAPDSYRGYSNLGAAFYYAERRVEARRAFERALEINPEDDLSAANLGTLYFFEGRFDEAAELFARAAALDEDDYFNVGNLADAYHWGGEGEEKARQTYLRAAEMCQDRLQVNPKEPFVLADRAYFLAMAGAAAEAEEEIEKALEVAPDDVSIQHRAAQVYHLIGQTETALQLLESSVEEGYPRSEVAADPLFADLKGNVQFDALIGESLP